jgi:hypothetical protein
MEKGGLGTMFLLVVIAIGLFGGAKNSEKRRLAPQPTKTVAQNQAVIQQEIYSTQAQVESLQNQIKLEEEKKNASVYKGIVTLSYVNHSDDPKQEYIVLNMKGGNLSDIPLTGWKLTSTNTGETVTIPEATYLFFSGVKNLESDVMLSAGDTLYLITGVSPIGASFKVNKCSGYLAQFQTFVPYLGGYCPAPRDENLASIPKIKVNDACFDYINSMPSCTAQTKTLPNDWSYECTHFITEKLNYPSCVNTHKGDRDFLKPEWRVYLKRSTSLWKDRRENIVLYDNLGKVVATLTY